MVNGVRLQTIQFEQSTLYGYVADEVERVQFSNRRHRLFLLPLPTWFRSEGKTKPWFYYKHAQIYFWDNAIVSSYFLVHIEPANKPLGTLLLTNSGLTNLI